MICAVAAAALAAFAAPALADGFAVSDLQTFQPDLGGFDQGYAAEATEPGRLTIACGDCAGFAAVDIRLGRSEDGTEQRYRSGETTIESLDAMCKAREASCALAPVEIGPAVGWLSSYNMGGMRGATAILFLEGDMLTIRSIADSQDTAEANARAALQSIAPEIIGGE